ncbi:protocatechuate 3,4-dioxygenase subunit alpha [Aureimonas phyllosphaerae]|uniref:Protocatechuate 3,4-dioxygenase alpha subunit n=1 Tax=Aureimonas phyllosphaerae TaxID=1166078 RepID=A0A7W6BXA1_9HYPH|nr:protocatechuate 3,4-dioxygenase subunit alpha [Aureimonas phyllosphaerae]MBB3937764.1 protocatechuate 3,4-dioxygenase alpha subunit [Aureimonas phyllosphaerae]MBB3961701.1 protocatechuate 3,4-dioxygenase alpha subunit [Aureimonas phyllosphaerae]SFF45758.1 protocatechuate 3,4-dioxygenase, alpha subunit [Aureimonas phyllosphaerae]
MVQRLDYLKESPSQTAGPYVHIGTNPNWVEISGVWQDDLGLVLVGPETKGERVILEGRVLDGAGNPVRDALIEIWQADADGLHNAPAETRGVADPAFAGWGRQPVSEADGTFRFETIRPGRVPWPDGRLQAPHVTVWIVARGINLGLHTRLYFGDEQQANAADPLLNRIPEPARRATLVAPRTSRDGLPVFTFDIRLQGEAETVFLDM